MEDSLLSEFNIFAKKIARAIDKSIDCKRVGIAVIGLEVAHAHIHLIPLYKDAINFSNPKLSFTDTEFKAIAKSISANIEN